MDRYITDDNVVQIPGVEWIALLFFVAAWYLNRRLEGNNWSPWVVLPIAIMGSLMWYASAWSANISGGIFKTGHDGEGTDYGAQYLLNCMDDAYKAETAKYVITGGTFYGFNPENNTAEGENTNYLTNAYTAVSIENGAAWTIATAVARNLQTGVGYTSVADGLAQAKSGETVQMLADSSETIIMIDDGITLDLNGNTLTATRMVAFGTGTSGREIPSTGRAEHITFSPSAADLPRENIPTRVRNTK